MLYHYQWGLPQFEDNRLSPGFVTGYLVMEEAQRRGLTELNWLAGDSRYKRDLSNGQRSLIWAEQSAQPLAHGGDRPDLRSCETARHRKRMIRGRV